MKLGDAMARVGGTIARTAKTETATTIYARFQTRDSLDVHRWRTMISYLLEGQGAYVVDVSRHYTLHGDRSVRYLWRFIFTADTQAGLVALGQCAVRASMSGKREFDSFPLVGRVDYVIDAMAGKTKGVHTGDQAEMIVAMHATRGGGVGSA